MAPWPNDFMIGTDLDTDFQTLNDLFDTSQAAAPDATFAPFSGFTDNVDGSRSGVGFPNATWKWRAKEDVNVDVLEEFWDGALSVPLYIRTLTNRVDIYGARIYRTFLCQALWPPADEDKQASYTLGLELEFRHLVIQEEAV
jgi:hypothetical protein